MSAHISDDALASELGLDLANLIRATRGFMPDPEGLALYRAARERLPLGPALEIGSYCGKSTLYLGAAAQRTEGTVFTVDHHRGSEELQPGWDHHDPSTLDAQGRIDTLPFLRRTLTAGHMEDVVIAIVGDSATLARHWQTPLSLVFIDGGHGEEPAHADYDGWAHLVMPGGWLAIHDVFPDPADGGRPPYEIYRRALADGFVEIGREGSLRLLRRTSG